MKNYDYVLFDLDGTVTESGPGVLRSMAYAMDKFSLPMPDDVPTRLFMGPPLSFSFRNYCHLPPEKIPDALRFYREYYSQKGIFECSVYPGLEDLFKKIAKSGKTLLVASSKPEAYVKSILAHFGLDGYFAFIGGADFEGLRGEKDQVLEYTLASAGVQDVTKAVMVGDREHDIFGAAKFGMDSIGVLYGYGSRDELTAAGATYLAETADDIANILGV